MKPMEHSSANSSDDLRKNLVAYVGSSTVKVYSSGTHRSRTPAETWRHIQPLFPDFGITRIANVTGLDRIGIPVWMAVRPNSRSLAVNQGKGLDHEAARVSAAMEALEFAHAERPTGKLCYAPYREISAEFPVVSVNALPKARRSLFTEHRPVIWIEAHDLVRSGAVWVPYEMVHSDATVPWAPGSGAFVASTNGLASGNNLAEAILHGLCEIVERDAMSLWEHLSEAMQSQTQLDLNKLDDPYLLKLLACYSAARISVLAWESTSDIGIAVIRCIIFDEHDVSQFSPAPAAFGAGCHPDRNTAFARALTEAAQSRLTAIAGSRDDLSRIGYRTTLSSTAIEFQKQLLLHRGVRDPAQVPTFESKSILDDLEYVVHHLYTKGLTQILVVDLSQKDSGVSVVRVVVPGLEGPSESAAYTPGRRVHSLLTRSPLT